jgi:FAD/FMN-containing dehydrogenase
VARDEHVIVDVEDRLDPFPRIASGLSVLPFGNGRSYGDCCLNAGGALLNTRSLDRFIHFDRQSGWLSCEAGVLLGEILQRVAPLGWFLPVVPGTQYVTVGGAIANDVHGKNHHGAGTFGRHVRRLELLRSTGERFSCGPDSHPDYFAATVGGVGLTGMITSAQLQLRRVSGAWMEVESIRFANLEEFFELSESSNDEFEYTVSWIDCLASGKDLGRGILQRARHSTESLPGQTRRRHFRVPFTPPVSLVNAASLRLFNSVYYHKQYTRIRRTLEHFQKFFFPLDNIRNWNRLYGSSGFYQYQCVIPPACAREAVAQLLRTIARSGLGSFLAVLKQFGPARSPGLLSFPRQGLTLALDFPNRPERVVPLFTELDAVVGDAGGRLYPAKDGRMPGNLFRAGFPEWTTFSRYTDPRCSSNFWRRVRSPV